MNEQLTASVQYNDFRGTAAADISDHASIASFLRSKGQISDDEHVVAVQMWLGENHGGEVKAPSLSAFVVRTEEHEGAIKLAEAGQPFNATRVVINLSLEEFFGFFKRFEIVICRNLEFIDAEVREIGVIEAE